MDSTKQEEGYITTCFNCNYKIKGRANRCPNCSIWLKPNNLKWRRSFLIFLTILCFIPIIIAIISYLALIYF